MLPRLWFAKLNMVSRNGIPAHVLVGIAIIDSIASHVDGYGICTVNGNATHVDGYGLIHR